MMSPTKMPNIIWLTLDSIRFDHTEFGEYHRETTPNLRQIAQSEIGLSFDMCIAHGPASRPSVTSILTGTYPYHNGNGFSNDRIPQQLDTIADILNSIDYYTTAISTNPHVTPETGANKGFNSFKWLNKASVIQLKHIDLLMKYALKIRDHSVGFSLDISRHSSDYITDLFVRNELKNIQKGKKEPFFMYAHYDAAHHPYSPTKSFESKFCPKSNVSEARDFAMDVSKNLYEYIAKGLNFSDREWEMLISMYDAEIAYIDSLIGKTFKFIKNQNLNKTIIVITSDHGELFGEQGFLAHKGLLSDALTRVPLVIHGAEFLTNLEDDLVQHIDILQTFLSYIGADTENLQGIDLRQMSRKYAYSQRSGRAFNENIKQIRKYNPQFNINKVYCGDLHSIRSKTHRLIMSENGSHLYELPDEENPVFDPCTERQMRTSLESFIADISPQVRGTKRAEMSDERKKQLRELGYID